MAFPQHKRVLSPNTEDAMQNPPVETPPINSAMPSMHPNPSRESSLDLNEDRHPQEEMISNRTIDLSVAAEAAKYPLVTLLQKLAASFRTRERNESHSGTREGYDHIATMIESALQMGSGMIASEVRMQGEAKVNAEEIATLHDQNQELQRDYYHMTGRMEQERERYNQILSQYRKLDVKFRDLQGQSLRQQKNYQASRVEIFAHEDGQEAVMGQTLLALSDREGEAKTSAVGRKLHVNSDEAGPPLKKARLPEH